MKYYLDIRLLPNAEANLGFIWQKVFQQVHFALVEHGYESDRTLKMKDGTVKTLKNSKIAVSFPEYGNHAFPLGSKLRLYAQTQDELEKLGILSWLSRLTDYVNASEIRHVSQETELMLFRQKRVKGAKRLKTSVEKKRKHLINKFGADFDPNHEGLNLHQSFEKTGLPFIQLESQTSKKLGGVGLFRIFIEKLESGSLDGLQFDCYGLALN